MALRLRVVSDHRRWLGGKSTIVFGVAGGSIGRSAENDWVLPDPQRYVSGRHARILFRQGAFYLEDTSTNGTFVNEAESPIGPRSPYELKNGDVLRIGEYHVVVALDAATDFAPDDSGLLNTEDSGRRARGAQSADLGASLRLEALLETSHNSASSSGLKPVNAFGQAVTPNGEPAPFAAQTDAESDAVARRIERLAKAASKQRADKAPGLYDVQSGLQTFCRGAGIDGEQLPPETATRVLHLAGQLLRESLLGLKDTARAHKTDRNRFRIEYSPSDDEQRPSLQHGTVEELLLALLKAHESRTRDGVQWIRERFEDARQHETSSLEAMRGAFVDFIARLDPKDLSTRFERASNRKIMGAAPQKWELYGEFYRNLTEMPANGLPHMFIEAFAIHYARSQQAAEEADAESKAS
jgi:type VI secretion system protein